MALLLLKGHVWLDVNECNVIIRSLIILAANKEYSLSRAYLPSWNYSLYPFSDFSPTLFINTWKYQLSKNQNLWTIKADTRTSVPTWVCIPSPDNILWLCHPLIWSFTQLVSIWKEKLPHLHIAGPLEACHHMAIIGTQLPHMWHWFNVDTFWLKGSFKFPVLC